MSFSFFFNLYLILAGPQFLLLNLITGSAHSPILQQKALRPLRQDVSVQHMLETGLSDSGDWQCLLVLVSLLGANSPNNPSTYYCYWHVLTFLLIPFISSLLIRKWSQILKKKCCLTTVIYKDIFYSVQALMCRTM